MPPSVPSAVVLPRCPNRCERPAASAREGRRAARSQETRDGTESAVLSWRFLNGLRESQQASIVEKACTTRWEEGVKAWDSLFPAQLSWLSGLHFHVIGPASATWPIPKFRVCSCRSLILRLQLLQLLLRCVARFPPFQCLPALFSRSHGSQPSGGRMLLGEGTLVDTSATWLSHENQSWTGLKKPFW